jgi:hypothetical protein
MLDNAVSLAIQKIDFVLTGAEAVVENGGIINKVLFLGKPLKFFEDTELIKGGDVYGCPLCLSAQQALLCGLRDLQIHSDFSFIPSPTFI